MTSPAPPLQGKEDTLMAQRPFRRVGAAMPKAVLEHFSEKLRHAGIRKDVRVFVGSWALLAFFLGAIPLLLYLIIINPIATPQSAAIAAGLFIGGMSLVVMLAYLKLFYAISDRTTVVEKVLPDFLLLTVSNLRAGMSPFASFVHAARPEFGPFYDEVRLSTAKTGGKNSLSEALNEVSVYFDSHVLRRTVSLFAKGLRSGGHLAKLLTSIAQEVRRIQDLRAELNASTKAYALFLAFIIVLIMPFLLSISTHFVTVFLRISSDNSASSDLSSGSSLPVFSGAILITTSDMVVISLAVILTTSFFASILSGIISRGRATYGLKYFPLLALAAAVSYFVSKAFIESFLSGFAS
ncbi:type II secretion system F family protein [Candidatus Micrarchaeota archaeon]|nr:type II secretion system F family protein [Candidatus Micrarchaeota archaeon]